VHETYLYHGPSPLINGLAGGLGHPLIHLAYAYELDNKELAMEAVAVACLSADHDIIRLINEPSPPTECTSNPLQLLVKLRDDDRFDSFKSKDTEAKMTATLLSTEKYSDATLEYFHSWPQPASKRSLNHQFEDAVDAAITVVLTTHKPSKPAYDFFLLHVLTSAHAVRILLPIVPVEFQINLLRQWWLLAVVVYISQLRPLIKENYIDDFKLEKGKDSWKWVEYEAVEGKWRNDSHFVKGVRAIRESQRLWGDKGGRYLKAAVKLCVEFPGWSFGSQGEESEGEELDVKS
jgi:Questin oxidase-like